MIPTRKTHEPILGYRAWWARKIRDPETKLWDVFLTSLTFDGVVWDGPVMRAPKLTPAKIYTQTGPGVYSYRTLHDAYQRLDASVFGEIEYSGLVGCFRLGYRGEAATIRRLFIYPGRWSKTLAEARDRPFTYLPEGGNALRASKGPPQGATYRIIKRPPFTTSRHDEHLCRALELKYQCDVEKLPIMDYLSHFKKRGF